MVLTSHRVAFVGRKISRTFGINEIMGLQEDDDNHLMISRTNKVRNEVFTLDSIKRELFIGLVQFLGLSSSIDKLDDPNNNSGKVIMTAPAPEPESMVQVAGISQDKAAKISEMMAEYNQEFVVITLLIAGNILCMSQDEEMDVAGLLVLAKKHPMFSGLSDADLGAALSASVLMNDELENTDKDPNFGQMFSDDHKKDIVKMALEVACADKLLSEAEEDQLYYWAGTFDISDDYVKNLIQTKDVKRTAS